MSWILSSKECSLTLNAFQWLNLWDLHAIDPLPHGQAGLRMSRLSLEVSQAVSRQNTAALSQADHPVDRVVSIPRFLVFSVRDNWRLKSRWRPERWVNVVDANDHYFLLLICAFSSFSCRHNYWDLWYSTKRLIALKFLTISIFVSDFRCKMSDNDTAIRKM